MNANDQIQDPTASSVESQTHGRGDLKGPGVNPEVLRLLRMLASLCRDSEAGYRLAYESAGERSLRIEFGRLVDEREDMARELNRVFHDLGEVPPARGTVLGGAHRIFLGLKTAIAGRDREEIIAEIVHGESVFEATFDALLKHDLPSAVEATVRDQHRSVRETRDHFRAQLSPRPDGGSTDGFNRIAQAVEKNPTAAYAILAAVATGFAAATWLTTRHHHPARRDYRL